MGEHVALHVDDGVGTIRLDRPPANAIDERMGREIGEAVEEAGARDDVRALVIWGGGKLFAAGADIRGMAELGSTEIRSWVSALGDACDAIESLPKVSIAAVNGFALGGGCELALACDLRYAAEDAQLGQPEVLIGVMPGAGGTQRLPRLVGGSRAMELILTGRRIDAREAAEIGLVHRVMPADAVYSTALEDAAGFARGPARAYAAAKAAVGSAWGGDPAPGLARERDAFCALFDTADQKEGMAAFVEKRAATFRGR